MQERLFLLLMDTLNTLKNTYRGSATFCPEVVSTIYMLLRTVYKLYPLPRNLAYLS